MYLTMLFGHFFGQEVRDDRRDGTDEEEEHEGAEAELA